MNTYNIPLNSFNPKTTRLYIVTVLDHYGKDYTIIVDADDHSTALDYAETIFQETIGLDYASMLCSLNEVA